MRSFVMVAALALMVSAGSAFGQAATKPSGKTDEKPMMGEMRIQRLAAAQMAYESKRTTLEGLQAAMADTFFPLMEKVMKAGLTRPGGAVVFVYRGLTPNDMKKEFDWECGILTMAPDAPKDIKMRELKEARCATMLLTGPSSALPEAWGKLMGGVMQAGLKPTGEMREYYLYWEDDESPCNITMLVCVIE